MSSFFDALMSTEGRILGFILMLILGVALGFLKQDGYPFKVLSVIFALVILLGGLSFVLPFFGFETLNP